MFKRTTSGLHKGNMARADEEGNIFVGDRQNHVVREIHKTSGIIKTIAGDHNSVKGKNNNLEDKDPLKPNLPEISSMDYYNGHLFVPTELSPEAGDLTVLRRAGTVTKSRQLS